MIPEEPIKPLSYNIWDYLTKRRSEISIIHITIGFILGQLFNVLLDIIKNVNLLDLIKLFLSR